MLVFSGVANIRFGDLMPRDLLRTSSGLYTLIVSGCRNFLSGSASDFLFGRLVGAKISLGCVWPLEMLPSR